MSYLDTRVTLDDVTFASYEVPPQIPFGGRQARKVHRLLGGARVIDSTGVDDRSLTWSGRFQGSNATDRAKHLDYLRRQGLPVTLSWYDFIYSVVIVDFTATWQRFYQVPYTITCDVVQDLTADVPQAPQADFDDMLYRDMFDVVGLALAIADGSVNAECAALSIAMQAVPTFIGASSAVLAPVWSALGAAQNAVGSLLSSLNISMSAPLTIGGVEVGLPSVTNAAALTAQKAGMLQLAQSQQLNCLLSRIGSNLQNAAY